MRSPQKLSSPVAKEEKRSRVLDVVVNEVVEDLSVTRSDGTPYIKRYHRGRYMGKGGFAKCYELISADSGKSYAGKVISKSSLAKSSAKKRLLGEIKVHRALHHENIVKFERFFEDKDNAYILLEICDNHSLIELLKKRKQVNETECQYIMWKLIHTLKYLHANKVIHRDLKLGNIFLSATMEIKVGDFGLATKLENVADRRRTMCGTPNYIAPEILEGTNGHSFEVDVWALGIIMYTVLIGRPPFETSSIKSTYKRIRANSYVFPANIPLSRAAKELIIAILHPDPALRPSLDQMAASPFFTQSSFPLTLPTSCLTQPLEWEHANPHLPCVKARIPLADKMLNVDAQSHDSPKFEGFEEDAEVCDAADKENIILKSPQADLKRVVGRSPVKLRRSPMIHLATTRTKSAVPIPNMIAIAATIAATITSSSSTTTSSSSSTTTSSSSSCSSSSSSASAAAAAAAAASSASSSTTTSTLLRSANVLSPSRLRPGHIAPSVATKKPSSSSSSSSSASIFTTTSITTSTQPPTVSIKLPSVADTERQIIAKLEELKISEAKMDHKEQLDDDDGSLRSIHDELEDCCRMQALRDSGELKGRLRQPEKVVECSRSGPDVFVNKWVDYSNKYGIGYFLSNGNTGVHFNDCTVLIMHTKGPFVEHIPRPNHSPEREVIELDKYPPALKKKVTLLKHFYQYLQQGRGSVGDAPDIMVDGQSDVETPNDGPTNMVYVRKWLRTKHALLFRLSNRTIQVIFYDNTELILSPTDRMVTYSNKLKERTTYHLSSIYQNPTPDLAKRMKYLKDILHHLLHRTSE